MRLNWTLYYVMWIEFLNLFILLEALKAGEKGVCTVTLSVQKTRTKWVTINKRCGKKKCTVKKTEKYSTPQQQTICCGGWEYNLNDTCSPICQPGCQGGQCTAPNECTCDPPSTPHPELKNICLSPKCDPSCVNADCVNNKCLCKHGFQIYNSTHCSKCGPGFSTTEHLECVPKCEGGCPNGKCTRPNECTCDEGYENNEFDVCVPVCTNPCKNGKCSAPNICTCDEGYQKNDTNDCEHICSQPCTNAKCTGPNNCSCHDGYQKNDINYCEPICSQSCINAKCTGPETCTCHDGYQKNDTNHCEPICSQSCINAKCTGPDNCTCHDGYQKNDTNHCEPICSQSCINAKCTGPDNCTCHDGYQKNDTNSCEPVCSKSCTNGKCTEPEICTCNEGYQKNDKNSCKPICTLGCTHGKCTEPNVCTCDFGFEKNASNVCVPKCNNCENGKCTKPDICICNPGYTKTISGSDFCEPICECVNSTCVAPNKCSCFDGFEKLNDTVCVPKCDRCSGACAGPNVCNCAEGLVNIDGECKALCGECENGHCVGDNCVCNEGFVVDGDHKGCVRDCTSAVKVNQTIPKNFPEKFNKARRCPSGYKECTPKEIKELGGFDPKKFRCCYKRKAVKQEIVACCEGYEYLNKSCHPICKPACDHGTCVAPDLCQCDQLYSWHDKKCIPSVCNPTCGTNTICSNDTCNCVEDTIPYNTTHCFQKCDRGYVINNISLVCEPHCESGCQDGTCVGPNTCNCNDGYKLENSSCVPVCEQCENGVCVSPNNCQCNEGYQSVNNSCTPVCFDCENGDCIAPDVCQCHEPDYSKHANGSCVPVCAKGCVNAECTAPNFCTCHSGYDKTDQHNLFECQPICDPKCVNATCVSPNSCNCFDGYEIIGNEWTCALKCNEEYVRNVSNLFTCYKPCKGPCEFGVCTRDGVCECRGGFELVNDTCTPLPPVDCSGCVHNCSDGECWCQEGRACTSRPEVGAEVTSTGLAAMELTWGLGGALVVLLVALVMGVMFHLYRRRLAETKTAASDPYGSVVYTVPDTLLSQRCPNFDEASEAIEANEATEVNEYEAPEANGNAKRLLSEECVQ